MAETKSLSRSPVLRFGVFQTNLAARELRKHGVRVSLPGQPFCILSMLLEKPGEIVTREEMRHRLWAADTFVDFEHSLNSAIKTVRGALGDSPENSCYIETVPRVGYRFIAPVETVSVTAPSNGSTSVGADRLGPLVAARANGLGAKTKLWKVTLPFTVVVMALAAGSYVYSHRTAKLTEKDTVVLADFANHTGDQIFDDTLKTALSVSLRQSPFLNVLSDDKVAATLKLMARPSTAAVTPEVARELCQRAGSKAYVAGSIASLGSQYVLGLSAVSCQSGDTLAQEQVTAPDKEKLLGALDEVASKLRSELGESIATVQKFDMPLAEATTSSLQALKAYSLGLHEQDSSAALAYLQRAIQLDPDFAAGYYAIGNRYETMGQVARASEYFSKAFQLRERASE